MILTSIKNYEKIKQNAEVLGITFKPNGGVIKITSEGISEENLSNRLFEDHGIGNIIDCNRIG